MKRQSKNGRPLEHDRPVRIVELDEVFPNYVEAAKRIDGNRGCVYQCLDGLRKKHKGYSFEYVGEK